MGRKLKLAVLIIVVCAWFLTWHDLVASEEQSSYFESESTSEVASRGYPYHDVGVGHGIEVYVVHPWLLDIIPLTSSLLYPLGMFFGYNLVPVHILFLVVVMLLTKKWFRSAPTEVVTIAK